MSDKKDKNVFEKLFEPLKPCLDNLVDSMPSDHKDYKLSLGPFTINLIYAVVNGIQTIGKLVVEIKTDRETRNAELVVASKSMYSEAFRRYDPSLFRKMFGHLLVSCNFLAIPEIESLGRILLVDGSIFPAIASMTWAEYKSGANALKMHLAFELNRMIPVQFICTEGNFSEKSFLKEIVEKGATYVCDRGYVSFEIFQRIVEKEAFFIIRSKSNALFDKVSSLEIDIPKPFLKLFDDIEDTAVVFLNDSSKIIYRVVKFTAMGELYILTTNRFDLSTYEVIMLYAYRWQIELYFRFYKRTLKGIHLMCNKQEGIQIQFYIYMIAHLLLMHFKQNCETIAGSESRRNSSSLSRSSNGGRYYVCGLVSILGEKLKKSWKIGLHWMIALRNSLFVKFDDNVIASLLSFT